MLRLIYICWGVVFHENRQYDKYQCSRFCFVKGSRLSERENQREPHKALPGAPFAYVRESHLCGAPYPQQRQNYEIFFK